MPPLSLSELELELVDLLGTQGLPVEELHLIGLLGKGTRATVFSVLIDGVYHVLKVYDSRESLKAEMKNLRKMTPKDRFLFSWQENLGKSNLNIAIIEVPEGQELNSEFLTDANAGYLANRLVELYRIRYRQKVSFTNLMERLERSSDSFLDAITLLGRDLAPYEKLLVDLKQHLQDNITTFRTRKVRIHGDLWWPNVIVAEEDVYLIDWESMHRGDPAADLAKLRIVIYWPRNGAYRTYFWRSPEHIKRLPMAMRKITDRYNGAVGNEDLMVRLRFYMPFLCIYELGQRYLAAAPQTDSSRIKSQILADEALALFENPLADPPDLVKYGFFDLINETNPEVIPS